MVFLLDNRKTFYEQHALEGLDLRMHIDEFSDGGGRISCRDGRTADHAHHAPMETRHRMKESGVMTGFYQAHHTPTVMIGQTLQMCSEMKSHFRWPRILIQIATLTASVHWIVAVQRNSMTPFDTVLCDTTSSKINSTCGWAGTWSTRKRRCCNFNILKSKHWESWCMTPSASPIESVCLEGVHIEF